MEGKNKINSKSSLATIHQGRASSAPRCSGIERPHNSAWRNANFFHYESLKWGLEGWGEERCSASTIKSLGWLRTAFFLLGLSSSSSSFCDGFSRLSAGTVHAHKTLAARQVLPPPRPRAREHKPSSLFARSDGWGKCSRGLVRLLTTWRLDYSAERGKKRHLPSLGSGI